MRLKVAGAVAGTKKLSASIYDFNIFFVSGFGTGWSRRRVVGF
jgi:hypothetical protein